MYTLRSKLLVAFLAQIFCFSISAQEHPRIVIALVVDQMTPQYIDRFWNDFGEGGFKKLINEGVYFPNTFYNQVPTYTAPGHASIFTGSSPSAHGIIGNNWYDRKTGKSVYCVEDTERSTIGSSNDNGKRSPKYLLSAGIGDMMKLASGGKAYVSAISIKDRSAILPAGQSGDLAVWWDDETGKWITSDHYSKEVPTWINEYQLKNNVYDYIRVWEPMHDQDAYSTLSGHDNFERGIFSSGASFPYDMGALAQEHGVKVLKYSPYGNSFTFTMGREMIRGSLLGKDFTPDLGIISFSSTDYIGHLFGPYSQEVKDTYLRFDKDLEEFIMFLESQFGGDFLLFLTSDHGVMPNAEYMKSMGIRASYFDIDDHHTKLGQFLTALTGIDGLVLAMDDGQVYLDEVKISASKFSLKEVEKATERWLLGHEQIQSAIAAHELNSFDYVNFPKANMQAGFHPLRSGNVSYVLTENTIDKSFEKGSSHGSPYNYDSRVPLIFYGRDIAKGKRIEDHIDIRQIAPTITECVGVSPPPMATLPSLRHYLKSK
ncbi:MAG: alkaline phosphatase family protein [Vicingaceae bacterium]